MNKGSDRPLFDGTIRAKSLLALQSVDFVIISNDFDCINTLKIIKPNYFVKDIEYANKNHPSNNTFEKEKKFIRKIKCKLVYTKQIKLSSSKIIKYKFQNLNDKTQSYLKFISKNFTYRYIEQKILKLNKLEICLIGDPILDTYIFCQTEGISSKSPTLASMFKNKETYSGGVLAVAKMASALGAKVDLLTYGKFYENGRPNQRRKELSELTFDIQYALVGSKRLKPQNSQSKFESIWKKFTNMINTQIKIEEKGKQGNYIKAIRASQLDDVVDMFKRNTQRSTRKQKDLL